MNKILFIITFFISGVHLLLAQQSTEFWFVAPEVTSENAGNDAYCVFRFVAYDEDATVTMSMPANLGYTPITFTVPAGGVVSQWVDKDIFENINFNQVANKGVCITSSTIISAYYEIAGANNPDKFVLKGNNALGTEFYIPSQNDLQNHLSYVRYSANEHVDIVATENDTEITIKVTDDVVGHIAGETFSVSLNKGETFNLTATDQTMSGTLAGTHITSTKDIAITVSDDSLDDVSSNPSHWDLIGDQIVPVAIIGTQYIMVRSHLNKNNTVQKAYIIATEDGTIVTLDGDSNWTVSLDEGEIVGIDIPNGSDAILIVGNKPIYVYQVTVYDGEMGSALLPHIQCSGSSEVAFNRNSVGYRDDFFVQLLCEEKDKDSFTLYDSSGDEVPLVLQFFLVKGTGENISIGKAWQTAIVDLSDIIDNQGAYRFVNSSGNFHMGILDFNGASLNFGCFSSYGSIATGIPPQVKKNKRNDNELVFAPNPFVLSTSISIDLQQPCQVNLTVYSLLGDLVREIIID